MMASAMGHAPPLLSTGVVKTGFRLVQSPCCTIHLLIGFVVLEYVHRCAQESSRVNAFHRNPVFNQDLLFTDCLSQLVEPYFLFGLLEGALLDSVFNEFCHWRVRSVASIIFVVTASTLWVSATHLCTAPRTANTKAELRNSLGRAVSRTVCITDFIFVYEIDSVAQPFFPKRHKTACSINPKNTGNLFQHGNLQRRQRSGARGKGPRN